MTARVSLLQSCVNVTTQQGLILLMMIVLRSMTLKEVKAAATGVLLFLGGTEAAHICCCKGDLC
jgi:hypothetical protein